MQLGLFLGLNATQQGGALSLDIVALGTTAISPTATNAIQWQNVHFCIDPAALTDAAADLGLTMFEFRREMECYWQFCATAGDAEDYAFTRYPANVMRTAQTAGFAAGPFAGHTYATTGTHTVSVLIHVRGRLYEASRTITVGARSYGTIGVCDPDDAVQAVTDFEAETGLTVAAGQSYTDIDAALAALNTGAIDTLACRRGKTYLMESAEIEISDNGPNALPQVLMGFGGSTGDLIDIQLDWGEGKTTTIYVGGVDTTDGTTGPFTADNGFYFSDSQLGSWPFWSLYLNGVLQDPSTYSRQDQGNGYWGIVFNAAPPTGQTLRIFRTKTPDSVNPASIFYPDEIGTGQIINTIKPEVFVLAAPAVLMRDVRVRGGYDASNPGYFDVRDLSTYSHYVGMGNAVSFKQAGDQQTNADGATLFNFEITGVRTGLGFSGGFGSAAVNGRVTNWYNYGAYLSGHRKPCIIGCSIDQSLGAFNASEGKSDNYPFKYNSPDHGPLRGPVTVQSVVNRCYLTSRNDWNGGFFASNAQPIIRMPQSSWAGTSVGYSENTVVGGSAMLPGGGSANEMYPLPDIDLVTSHGNVCMALSNTGAFAGGNGTLTSINDTFIMAVPAGGDFNVSGNGTGDGYFADSGYKTNPRLFLNPTVVLSESPSGELRIWRKIRIVEPGLHAQIVRGLVVDTAGSSVTFPTSYGLGDYGNFHRRVWWLAAADAAAIDADDVTYPDDAAKKLAKEIAANGYTTMADQDLDFTITHTGQGQPITIEWKSGRGSWAVGDVVWVTNETTAETVPRWNELGEEVVSVSDTHAPGVAQTFCINGLSTALVMDDLDVRNPLIVVTGDWASFRLNEDDAPITDMTTPMDPYRLATFAPLSAGYRQPQTGSSAIGAATVNETHRDALGTALSPARRTLGALEPESDISGRAALPALPSDDAAVALTGLPFSPGQTVTTAANVVYTAPSNLGTPAATVYPAIEVVRDPLTVPQSDIKATSVTVQAGDRMRSVLHIESEAGGRVRIPGPEATVSSGNFVPSIIRSVNADGSSTSRVSLRNPQQIGGDRHFAFRIRIPGGTFSGQDNVGQILGNNKMSGGGATDTAIAWNPRGLDASAYVDIFGGGDYAEDVWVSFLVSELPSNNATPGATRFRVTRQIAGEVSPTVVIDDTTTNVAQDFVPAGDDIVWFGTATSAANASVFDIEHSFGVWVGGNPSFADFFNANGLVKEWAANPDRGVGGMTCAWLFAGVDDFNDPSARNRGSYVIQSQDLAEPFREIPRLDPEAGLSVTHTADSTTTITLTDIPSSHREQTAVVAIDAVWPVGVVNEAVLFEIGADARGAFVGYAGGDFMVRCGDGVAGLTSTGTSYMIIPAPQDGLAHTLVVEFASDGASLRAWLDDVPLAGLVAASVAGTSWAGGDNGRLGSAASTATAGITTTWASVGGTATEVRLYTDGTSGQTSSA